MNPSDLMLALLLVVAVLACYDAILNEITADGGSSDLHQQELWGQEQLAQEPDNQAMHQQLEEERNQEIEQEIKVEVDQLLAKLDELLSSSSSVSLCNASLEALLEF